MAAGLLLAAVVAIWGGWHFLRRGPGDRPAETAVGAAGLTAIRNVLLVSIDTCRADRLSCYGYKRGTTPNIDALAREGALFKTALTPVPITTPAHCSMLTGTYPPTHGVHLNSFDRLAGSNVTLATVLRQAGYQTAAFVGAFPLECRFGLNQGFETYDGRFNAEGKKEFFSRRTGEEVSRPAMAWLGEHAQKPFFLFLHYYDAHRPYAPHPPVTSPYMNDPYAGEIAYIDNCIGRVLERLRTLGVYDNTLVIVTGDHGEGLGEHGEDTHSYFVYQGTLHVPLVVRAPGCPKGIAVEQNASLVDIVPTVLGLVGLKVPARVEGVDLRAALEGGGEEGKGEREKGRKGEGEEPRAVYAESLEAATYGCSPLHAIVEGPWKYILAPRAELYNLAEDPGEATNLAAKAPQVAQRLRGRLEAMLKELEAAATRHGPATADAETERVLGTLGYVSGGAAPPAAALDTTREDPKDFLATYQRCLHARLKWMEGSGHNAEAKQELREIAASRPGLIMPHKALADIAQEEGRKAEAAAECAKIVALLGDGKDPARLPAGTRKELAEAHYALGQSLQMAGKADEAIGHYEQALRLNANYVEAHVNLGLALLAKGKLAEAAAHEELALRLKPDYADAHLSLGNVLRQAGKLREAAAHYELALRLKPDFAEALVNQGNVLRLAGKPGEAITHYEQALRLKPADADAHLYLGNALQQSGKLAEAIAHCEQALRLKPDWAEAHVYLGNALKQSGKADEAMGHYREALRLKPDDALAHVELGTALCQSGKAGEAAGHYEQALRMEAQAAGGSAAFRSALPTVLNNLAWIRATDEDPQLRNGAEAVGLAQRACGLLGRHEPGTLSTLAAAYAEAGRFPEAIAAAEEALGLAAKQPALAGGLRLRLDLYRAGKACRERRAGKR